jgi:predicted  nucleic acid-binding Zn-ribbon protein
MKANDTVKKLEEEVAELNDRVKSLNEKLQKESASRYYLFLYPASYQLSPIS